MSAEKKITLKPCPFCGSRNVRTIYIRDGRKAVCDGCHSSGSPEFNGPDGMHSADERAVEAWNKRAGQ